MNPIMNISGLYAAAANINSTEEVSQPRETSSDIDDIGGTSFTFTMFQVRWCPR